MKALNIILMSLLMTSVQAALPPSYQNTKDLDVMVGFIKSHPEVAERLRNIDLDRYIIHYGDDCKAEFIRQMIDRPDGWVGPAEPLELKSNGCA